MTNTQKAILPGILVGIALLVGLHHLVNPSLTVNAATQPPEPASQCQFLERYPEKVRPWCVLIESIANQYGVDALLVASVMLQESGGQPEVMSTSGAVGLMQIMPRDGIAAGFQCINGPCFTNRPTIEELKDPAFNVDFGVRMLAGLIKKHGDVREALKSYGPYDVGYRYADQVLSIRNSL